MKTLFISNDPTIFEPKSAARARMRTYAAAIGELHILSRAERAQESQEDGLYLHGMRPLPTQLGRVLFLRTLTAHAHELIGKYGIEVVSAQDPFEHGVVAAGAIRSTTAKLHIQVHTDFCSPFFAKESRKNAMRMRLADSVLPKAAGIRVVSERVKKGMLKRYGNRIPEPSVIPLSMEITSAPPAPPKAALGAADQLHAQPQALAAQTQTEPPQAPLAPAAHTPAPLPKLPFTFILAAVGRLEKEKRFEDAIATVAKLRKERYPAGLLVVGAGRERARLAARARHLGITPYIVFLGERSNIPAILTQANAFIQTSAYEGYGRTYFEAARAGVPMVVTDAGIVGEVFRNEESALVCPVGDVECLTREVSRLIEDMALRRQISEHAAAAAAAHEATLRNIPERIAEDLRRLAPPYA